MKFVILILALVAQSANAAKTCEIEQSGTPSGDERIFKIKFKDGRKLTVVGQNHGDRDLMFKLLAVPEGKGYFDRIREVLKGSEGTIKHYQEDVLLLRAAAREGARFVGYETAEDVMPQIERFVSQINTRMNQHSVIHREKDPILVNDATLMIMGAPPAMRLLEPSSLRNVSHVAFEEHSLNQGIDAAYDSFAKVKAELLALTGEEHEDFAADLLQRVQYQFYDVFDPKDPEFQPRADRWVDDYVPEKYKEVARRLIAVSRPIYILNGRRDAWTARQILDRKTSGIHFIGAVHSHKIMLHLAEACRTGKLPPKPDGVYPQVAEGRIQR